MNIQNFIKFGIYCILLQCINLSIQAAAAPVGKAGAKVAPAAKTAPVVTKQAAQASPVLTSVYIHNTSDKDATLHKVTIVIANQKKPLVKKGLKINVPGKKSIYDKGSMISFDITADSSNYAMFNGVKSIKVGDDDIEFSTLKIAFQSDPIKITRKKGKWIVDNS